MPIAMGDDVDGFVTGDLAAVFSITGEANRHVYFVWERLNDLFVIELAVMPVALVLKSLEVESTRYSSAVCQTLTLPLATRTCG